MINKLVNIVNILVENKNIINGIGLIRNQAHQVKAGLLVVFNFPLLYVTYYQIVL